MVSTWIPKDGIIIIPFPSEMVESFLRAIYGLSIQIHVCKDVINLLNIADMYSVERVMSWGLLLLKKYLKQDTLKYVAEWANNHPNKELSENVNSIIKAYISTHQEECLQLLTT